MFGKLIHFIAIIEKFPKKKNINAVRNSTDYELVYIVFNLILLSKFLIEKTKKRKITLKMINANQYGQKNCEQFSFKNKYHAQKCRIVYSEITRFVYQIIYNRVIW